MEQNKAPGIKCESKGFSYEGAGLLPLACFDANPVAITFYDTFLRLIILVIEVVRFNQRR